ncbi:MAG: oligoribonuclease [Planctomycetes bacterium]|nr:oligoribonuclease [Planctomycetota bacterium]
MADELKLVWIDLEMTGLDPDVDSILEIACIITGPDLEPLDQYEAVIKTSNEQLAKMNDFVRDMHTRNGLLERVKQAETTIEEAQAKTLDLVKRHCAEREGVLAGNSIHQDRRFLYRYMPQLEAWLHYRQVDVSSFKLLARAWYPDLAKYGKADKDHTALADIKESINELRYYREHILR